MSQIISLQCGAVREAKLFSLAEESGETFFFAAFSGKNGKNQDFWQ
jgi:hypothetical protein